MKTRIGFFLTPAKGWLGGINYFRNLFLAITSADPDAADIFLFVPPDVDPEALEMMLPSSSKVLVVRTSLLRVHHPWWFAWRVVRKLLASELLARPLVRHYRLDAVSHSDFLRGGGACVVNWLPDFQHLHLPQLFNASERQSRVSRYNSLARHAHRIVVSSEDARGDLLSELPDVERKTSVLRFVSSVPDSYWSLGESDRSRLESRYGLDRDYFFVPNQFWQHKNHGVLLGALEVVKEHHARVQIVCCGATVDPRNPTYFDDFHRRAAELGCGDALRILGVIPREDVFGLIRFSRAVINPSRFEGWSSTVEECKSVDKRMLLSNIAVHREQMPRASFFDPDKPEELAELLQKVLASPDWGPGPCSSERIPANYHRLAEYGAHYLQIVGDACGEQTSAGRRQSRT
jgi:glycosyltransferase involved in cell wall biosynthesis